MAGYTFIHMQLLATPYSAYREQSRIDSNPREIVRSHVKYAILRDRSIAAPVDETFLLFFFFRRQIIKSHIRDCALRGFYQDCIIHSAHPNVKEKWHHSAGNYSRLLFVVYARARAVRAFSGQRWFYGNTNVTGSPRAVAEILDAIL